MLSRHNEAAPRASRGSLVWEMIAASVVIALVVGAIFALLLNAIDGLRDANRSARRASDILASANRLEKLVVDLETGLRGYLVTDDRAFLAPYQAARSSYRDEAAGLDRLIQVPVQRRRLTTIERDVRAYLSTYSQPLIRRTEREGLSRAAVSRVIREGKRRIDEIRQRFEVFASAEERIIAQRRGRADDKAKAAIGLAAGGSVVSVLLLALLATGLARGVARPVRRVSAASRRLADGDLTARVEPSGPAEVAVLGSSFNQMAVELQRAEALKEEFFALVSHELRTPLTSIVGYTDVLREELDEEPGPPIRKRAVERIGRAARRLSRLVGDLLFVAEIDAGKLSLNLTEEADLEEIATESVDGLRHRAEARGQTLTLDAEPVRLDSADPDRLGQVVDNLLANALKFTPDGGRVAVEARAEGDDALLTVSDTGIGIAEEEQNRLFERFFRASSATEGHIQGVGLGLSIVNAIVTGHGGSVGVRSALGQGTTFTVRMPLAGRSSDEGRADD